MIILHALSPASLVGRWIRGSTRDTCVHTYAGHSWHLTGKGVSPHTLSRFRETICYSAPHEWRNVKISAEFPRGRLNGSREWEAEGGRGMGNARARKRCSVKGKQKGKEMAEPSLALAHGTTDANSRCGFDANKDRRRRGERGRGRGRERGRVGRGNRRGRIRRAARFSTKSIIRCVTRQASMSSTRRYDASHLDRGAPFPFPLAANALGDDRQRRLGLCPN